MGIPEEGNIKINLPEWTEIQEKSGLDPLGMQNSSIVLYQSLMPGISNVTLRMRYYGYYAWVCWQYAQHIGDTDTKTWQRFLRKSEALYALIAQHAGNELGIAGITWATNTLAALEGDTIDFADDAEPGAEGGYLKQAWGAYGAAYGGQLNTIGILSAVEGHEIPVPSEEVGHNLAQLFDQQLDALSTPVFEVIKNGSVTLKDLDRFAVMLPSNIGKNSDEQSYYEKILFSDTAISDVPDQTRKLSLILILAVAKLLGQSPSADEARWILYAGADSEGNTLELEPQELQIQRTHWWVYQANDLCHYAVVALFKFALDVLDTQSDANTFQKLIPRCVKAISDEMEKVPENWNDFIDQLELPKNPYGSEQAESEWNLAEAITPYAKSQSVSTPSTAWQAIKLLGTLYKRVQVSEHDISEELGGLDRNAFHSLLTESIFLEANGEIPFKELLSKIFEERILQRHLWVAMRKFRYQKDYTFLFDTDEGKLRLRRKDGPGFTTPRLATSIAFLKDIHLVNETGITEHGFEMIQ